MARVRFPFGHFPFPVPLTAGPVPNYVAVPLATALRWYWRVRNWRASCTWSMSVDFPGGTAVATAITSSGTHPTAGANGQAASEADLVTPCGLYFDELHNTVDHLVSGSFVVTPGPDRNVEFAARPNVQLPWTGMRFDPATQTCYLPLPSSYAMGEAEANGPSADLNCGAFAQLSGGGGVSTPGMSGNIDGIALTVTGHFYAYAGQAALTIPDNAATLVCSLTPVDYWPYVGEDGVTLWDSSTGEPAINPATGAPFTPAEIVAAPCP